MQKLGLPPGCSCKNFFYLNGKPVHDDDCPQSPSSENDDDLLAEIERLRAEESWLEDDETDEP